MKTLNTLALIACLAASAAAQTTTTTASTTTSSAPADVVGTWDVTVTTTQGQAIPSQLKLKKEAAKLVGTIASQAGEVAVEAEVKDKTLSVWFSVQGQGGQAMAIELAGAVDGDTVKGTMAIGGQPGGAWVATRAKDPDAKPTTTAPANDQPAAAKSDLTGTWGVSVELPNMTATPTMVLKQEEEKLTGDYVSAQYGKFAITGTAKRTAKGNEVNFSFAMSLEGTSLNVAYTGIVDTDGSIKGSVNYGDMMAGTFVATKNK